MIVQRIENGTVNHPPKLAVSARIPLFFAWQTQMWASLFAHADTIVNWWLGAGGDAAPSRSAGHGRGNSSGREIEYEARVMQPSDQEEPLEA